VKPGTTTDMSKQTRKHTMIEPGQPAPDFVLQDQTGQTHRLDQYQGRWVVLYFYPKDSTPGCTQQACDFRDATHLFTERQAVVLGVSADSVGSHKRFADKHRLTFPLLVDPDAATCRAYGVWQPKQLFGIRFTGAVRTTYLIDPHGRVAYRWDRVRVRDHTQAVAAKIDEQPSHAP
jgi:peroxiredoxin Q/BCP